MSKKHFVGATTMEISSDLAGTRIKTLEKKISFRETSNYAAAVQDNNKLYFDDIDKKPVAHPMFAAAVTWPVLSRLEDYIESEDFPRDVLLTQVHYSEHLIIRRLISPGDNLKISGSIKALLPHRAGTHAIISLEAEDDKGFPVFTEYVGAMLRGVNCHGGEKNGTLPEIPERSDTGILWQYEIEIDHLRPYIYDGCTHIEFPIHTSPAFAKAVGLPGIILQGTATLAYAVSGIIEMESDKDPNKVQEIFCNFTDMVMPGTEIKVCLKGSENKGDYRNLFFEVLNGDGKKAIRNGYIKLKG